MRNIIMAGALALVVGTLSGCARMPTQQELASIDYGSPIMQGDAEAQAKAFLARSLKDPYSAVYSWEIINTGWVKAPPILGGGIDAGWVLKGTVNAKNSYGGYVGERPYQFMFRDGRLAHVWSADNENGIMMKVM